MKLGKLYEQYLSEMDFLNKYQKMENKEDFMMTKREQFREAIHNALIIERNTITNLGVLVPQEQIRKEFKKIPWWKRLFMTPKTKKLKKAQITLDKITELRKT